MCTSIPECRYLDFLERLRVAGADKVMGADETGSDVSLRDWSALRCRVEEGFSRSSKVLEDGTIQVSTTQQKVQRVCPDTLPALSALSSVT